MKILYHLPSKFTIYAGRTIYVGYKKAFLSLGHEFKTVTAGDNQAKVFMDYEPDIFISSISNYAVRQLDLTAFKKARKKGMVAFMNIHFWNSPISKFRINESQSLRNDKNKINLIKSNLLGDVFFNSCEQSDARMKGFEEETGYKFYTVPLAVDKITLREEFDKVFKADISFVGTCLPQKRDFFKNNVFPLAKKYNVRLYGQDWTAIDRILGWAQRGGQYFNIPYLRSIRKPKLQLQDEAKIYKSSTISINVHEDYQRKYGGDCNERTFKIPFCGGFEIADDVSCLRKYFKEGEELVIAQNEKDWREKIDYYIKNPEERLPIIKAGKRRVLADHTYHNRVAQIIKIYKGINKI